MACLEGRFALLVGCVSVLSVGACGGVTAVAPDAGGGDAPVEKVATTTAEGCKAVAKALCDTLNSCAPSALKGLYGDETICSARAELGCMTDQMVPGIKRTPDDLLACAAAMGPASCSDLIAGYVPDVCAVSPGETIDGAACGSDWQCKSTFCNKTDKCGVCGPRQAAGGTCAADQGCVKGLVCANKKCTAPAGPGAACSLPNQPCRTDLYCTSPSGSGTCAAKKGAGGMCADSDQACDFVTGAICNPGNKTCESVSIAKGGEQCGLGIKTICVGFVDPCSNILLGGVCANPAQDGEACGMAGKKCVPPADCVMNVCRLPSAPDCH